MSHTHPIFGGDEAGQGARESAQFVVLPVPFESTVSYGAGTRLGPAAILEASEQLELVDEETLKPYFEPGAVHTMSSLKLTADPEGALVTIAKAAKGPVDAGQFLLTLGGEHSVTVGAVRPVAARHPDMGMLIVDAHLDLRNEYEDSPYSHACAARRVIEEHGIPVQWCGIRSVSQEEADYVTEHGLKPYYAHALTDKFDWIERLVAELPEKVYLSIDLDGLDPSVLPGTGTPEPGGLSYRQLLALIRTLVRERTVVAADVVELAPIPDQQVSETTAARLIYKLFGSLSAR